MFCGLFLAMFCAISSSDADPEPLSLMPGPAWTESRCAPAITTLSSLTPGSSAMTFFCGRCSGAGTKTFAVEPGLRECDTLRVAGTDHGDADDVRAAEGPDDQVLAVGRRCCPG